MHLQRIAVIACTVADFAGNVNVRQEIHLYLIHAIALAGLAASSLHIKAEASCLIASQLGLIGLAEELADKIKNAGIGCRIGARCTSDWGLVDVDDLIRIFYALNAVVLRSSQTRTVELGSQGVIENIIYQSGFTAAAHACYYSKDCERNADINIFEIVGDLPFIKYSSLPSIRLKI